MSERLLRVSGLAWAITSLAIVVAAILLWQSPEPSRAVLAVVALMGSVPAAVGLWRWPTRGKARPAVVWAVLVVLWALGLASSYDAAAFFNPAVAVAGVAAAVAGVAAILGSTVQRWEHLLPGSARNAH